MKEKVKVLHVLFDLGTGGVENLIYNYYSYMNKEKIHFDFLIHSNSNVIGEIEKRFIMMGSTVHRVTPSIKNFIKSSYEIYKKLNNFEYDIIHVHTKNFSFVPLYVSKMKGVKTRISHSHSVIPRKGFLYNIISDIFSLLTSRYSNYKFACSSQAGKSLFKDNNFEIVPNAIDIEQFLYDENVSKSERVKLGTQGSYVIALVGRFDPDKNHKFAIDIFNELIKKRNNTMMVFIGNRDGEEYERIESYVKKMQVENKIIFLDYREDIANFYQGIDLLLLPSKSEGFGMVTIEAQAAGVPCLCSEAVPIDTRVTNSIEFLNIESGVDLWVEKILHYMDKQDSRDLNRDIIMNSRFNIKNEAIKLEKFYWNRRN